MHVCMCVSGVCLCACVHLPLGGGLMSASPCWLELSDCPDSTEKENESLVCCFAIKWVLLKNKGSSWHPLSLLSIYVDMISI